MEQQLFHAVKIGDLPAVKQLIAQGADVHACTDNAFFLAIRYGHLDIVKWFVEHGANIYARDGKALVDASMGGHFEIVKYLVEQGADVHFRNDSALTTAAYHGHFGILKYLIAHNANIYTTKGNILWQASHGVGYSIIRYLLDIYIRNRYFNGNIFAASILVNNIRYIKTCLKHDVNSIAHGYFSNINVFVSKLIVRNRSPISDVRNMLAEAISVYKIFHTNKYNNRTCKMRRQCGC